MNQLSAAFRFVPVLGGLAFLAILGTQPAWGQGNSAAARWCAANFAPGQRGQCVSQAAHGAGPVFSCGPAGTNVGLCGGVGGVCCASSEVCAANACATPTPTNTPTLTATNTPTQTPTTTNTPTETPTETPTSAPACTGQLVGGACWFLGAPEQSCDTVCTAIGLTCDPATATYAGSEGTDANCEAVLTALLGGACVDPSCFFQPNQICQDNAGFFVGIGCVDAPFYSATSTSRIRCGLPPTNCAASVPSVGLRIARRACACR